eukprot:4907875-Prorocentrum_lima.AAC.1
MVTAHVTLSPVVVVAKTCAAWCMPVASAGQMWMPAALMYGSRSMVAYSAAMRTVGRAASRIWWSTS